MLKNDTLKNGTSRIGLYGSAPRGVKSFRPALGVSLIGDVSGNHDKKLKFIVHFLSIFKDCSVA